MQGYIFLFLLLSSSGLPFPFLSRMFNFSYKACTRELNFSFCELWLCLSFSCRCSAQQEGLVGSVAFCPQNVANMQLCGNIWIASLERILTACMWISFSSHVGMMCSAFQGPLFLWGEQRRTLMFSCFCLTFFLSLLQLFFFFNTSGLFQ